MYKKTRTQITQLCLLIIFILIIPLVFIIFEAIHNIKLATSYNPDDAVDSVINELYNKVQSAPKNNDSSTIRKCLNEVFGLINEKNYTKLYSLLTDDIKAHLFPTEAEFEEYMKDYLTDITYSPKFLEYTKLNKEENDIFIVKVEFLPYSTNKSDIFNDTVPSKKDTFTLYIEDDSSYKFSFLSFIGTGESEHNFTNDSISCRIAATHLYTSQTSFDIEITNKTSETIFIGKDEICVKTGAFAKLYSSSVIVPPNSTKNFTFTIYTGLNLKSALPQDVYFNGVHVKDTVYVFYLPIKYPVKVSSLYI